MEFNSTANKNGILQNCESLCGLGDGGITGNATLLAKFTGWANDAYGKTASAILKVDKNWRWDDFNYGGSDAFPVATVNLVNAQRDYLLPRATNSSNQSTLWKVYKVRIKDASGVFYDVMPLGSDESEIADSGKPTKYRLLANSIRLSGPPATGQVTLTSGLQVWFQREFTRFTTASTTAQPGFISSFHYLLPLDASATYLLPIDPQKSAQYMSLFREGLENIKAEYANRNDDPQNRRLIAQKEDNR